MRSFRRDHPVAHEATRLSPTTEPLPARAARVNQGTAAIKACPLAELGAAMGRQRGLASSEDGRLAPNPRCIVHSSGKPTTMASKFARPQRLIAPLCHQASMAAISSQLANQKRSPKTLNTWARRSVADERTVSYEQMHAYSRKPGNGRMDIYWVDAAVIERARTELSAE